MDSVKFYVFLTRIIISWVASVHHLMLEKFLEDEMEGGGICNALNGGIQE